MLVSKQMSSAGLTQPKFQIKYDQDNHVYDPQSSNSLESPDHTTDSIELSNEQGKNSNHSDDEKDHSDVEIKHARSTSDLKSKRLFLNLR